MKIKNFKEYVEGADVTTIPENYLVFPSKNVLSYKGSIYTQRGMVLDGVSVNVSKPIIGEFTWKDHPTGEKKLRAWNGRLEIFLDNVWCTIDDQLNVNATEIRFATWLEDRTDLTGFTPKKRLLYVDNTNNIREWLGGIAKVQSGSSASGAVQYIEVRPGESGSVGKNYSVGDILTVAGGNNDAKIRVNKVSTAGSPIFNYRFGTVIDTYDLQSSDTGFIVGDLLTVSNSYAGGTPSGLVGYQNPLYLVIQVTAVDGSGRITGHKLLRNTYGFKDTFAYIPMYHPNGRGHVASSTYFRFTAGTEGGIMDWEIIDPGTGYSGRADDFNAVVGGTGTGATTSYTAVNGSVVTIAGTNTPEQSGFERLNVGQSSYSITPKVAIVRKTTGAFVALDKYDQYVTTTDNDIVLSSPFITVPSAGDYIVSGINTISLPDRYFKADDIFSFNNRVVIFSLSRSKGYAMNRVYRSFNVDAVKTADSAYTIDLTSNYTAMKSYKGASNLSTLYVSDSDGFSSVTEGNYGTGVYNKVERAITSNDIGSLPFCMTQVNDDIWYLAKDRTVRSLTTTVLNKDGVNFVSDKIDGYLKRVSVTNAHTYYKGRYFYIVLPNEGEVIMRDVIDQLWQPPYTSSIRLMTFSDGKILGHSNNKVETYQLFVGFKKLGAEQECIIALGTHNGGDEFSPKCFDVLGIAGRISGGTKVLLETMIENEGAKQVLTTNFSGLLLKKYDDNSLQSNVLNPVGYVAEGSPLEPSTTKHFIGFDSQPSTAYLELQCLFTITGESVEFILNSMYTDEAKSERVISADLFIPNPLNEI